MMCVLIDRLLIYFFTIQVWNAETEECMHTLSGHTNRVYSLLVRFTLFYSFINSLYCLVR